MKLNSLSNEKGTILLSVMGFVIALFIAGVAANNNVNLDIANSVNNLSSTQSLYIAEAGLERAKGELVSRYITGNWNGFNTILSSGILSFGDNVTFHGGTYSVRIVNDTKDPNPYNDTNNSVTIESTGIFKKSITRLRMTIVMNKVPKMQGSVTLLGEADTLFNGTSFSIDGRDYRFSDSSTPTGTDNQYAIITQDGNSKLDVINSMSDDQKINLNGLGYDTSASPVTPSVGVSTSMTIDDVKLFINLMKNVADSKLINPDSLDGVDLGSVLAPKITYITSTDSTPIKVNGNTTGAGILVVEGGNLEITINGNMSWTGIIIVSGYSVGFKETGSGQVKGGIVVLENNNPDVNKELEVGGNFLIKFSSEAIAMANNMVLNRQKYSIVSWQRVS